MANRERLTDQAIEVFLGAHRGWALREGALSRTFAFKDYGGALGFAVRVGLAAEKRDHHPELLIAWGKARVEWTTHDRGGLTALDTEMAAHTDELYGA